MKDKYDYEFPKDVVPPNHVKFPPPSNVNLTTITYANSQSAPAGKNQVKFPLPIIKPNKVAPQTKVVLPPQPPEKTVPTAATTGTNLDDFYKYLSKNIHYPAEDRENNVVGRVIARFTVNSDNKIDGVDVLRSPSNNLAKEVLRVLKNCTFPADLKPGSVYVVPVSFAIRDKNDNYVSNPASDKYDIKLTYGTPITQTAPSLSLNEVVIISYS